MKPLMQVPPKAAPSFGPVARVTLREDSRLAVIETPERRGTLMILSSGVVRIQWDNGADIFHTLVQPLLRPPMAGDGMILSQTQDEWIVSAGAVKVHIANDARITVLVNQEPKWVFSQWWASGTALFARLDDVQDDAVYGLGEKTGTLNKRSRLWSQWATDIHPHLPDTDAMYQAIPVMVLARPGSARGIFLANTHLTYFNLIPEDHFILGVDDGPLSLYCYCGPTLPQVLEQHTDMTSRPFLPPRWALGFQQSRYSYESQNRVLELAQEFRRRKIGLDVIYLDIHYMDGYRIFTWDAKHFPDPEKLWLELLDLGIRGVTIVDPGVKDEVGYAAYDSISELGAIMQYANGNPFRSQVWPGVCVFPDFAQRQAREWWARQIQLWRQYGVAGVWNDMNEPALFGADLRNLQAGGYADDAGLVHQIDNHQALSHLGVHNVYALLQAAATVQGLTQDNDERPFLLSRSGFAGIQRFAAVWTGDNSSWWEHLAMAIPMCLNLGLSGVPFVGPDIGGFFGAPSAELFARWIQMGVFFPFVRVHTNIDTPDQEPWSFGPEVEDIARRYIGYRYRLLPYLETLFEESHRTGAPIMRPLFWEFADDPVTYEIVDQFLLGSSILVAPVLQPGARERLVYLPGTAWYDPWSHTLLSRGWHQVDAPLDRLPVFIRIGGIIPLGPCVESTEHLKSRWLTGEDGPDTFWVIRGHGQFTCYSDDGHSRVGGEYPARRIRVEVQDNDEECHITVLGHWPNMVSELHKGYQFRVAPYVTEPSRVTINGTPAEWNWDSSHRFVQLRLSNPLGAGIPLQIHIFP